MLTVRHTLAHIHSHTHTPRRPMNDEQSNNQLKKYDMKSIVANQIRRMRRKHFVEQEEQSVKRQGKRGT